MIVLNVTYKCKPDMREEFYEMILAEGLDEASRAEAGNLKYDYYFPVNDSDEMLLVEMLRLWRSTASSRISQGWAN